MNTGFWTCDHQLPGYRQQFYEIITSDYNRPLLSIVIYTNNDHCIFISTVILYYSY